MGSEAVRLEQIDVSVHEAYLAVRLGPATVGAEVIMFRDGAHFRQFVSAGHDILVIDSALSGGTTYSYSLSFYRDGLYISPPPNLHVTTLQPTNYTLTWELFRLGGSQYSSFIDVCIVNDSTAYAAGEIYGYDSSGAGDIHPYCLAVWNGTVWRLTRLRDSGNMLIPSLTGVFVTDQTTVWLADGGIFRWDGFSPRTNESYSRIELIGGSDNGQSVDDLCGVESLGLFGFGRRGFAARRSVNQWEKLSVPTTTGIQSPFGYFNPFTGRDEIICPVTTPGNNEIAGILKLTDEHTIVPVQWSPQTSVTSVWTSTGVPLFACGNGLFRWSNDSWQAIQTGIPEYHAEVHGTALNDIYVCGVFGSLSHFDGENWHLLNLAPGGNLFAMDIKNGMVIAVGAMRGQALIAVGRRP